MRFNGYLWEAKVEFWTPEDKGKDIQKLYDNCSEIIEIYKKTNRFLYRGLHKKQPVDKIILKKPRKMRKPKDTSLNIHKIADKVFLENFGWKVRTQGVFATSDYDASKQYGANNHVHIIFPFDGFEYVWSSKVEDAYTDIFDSEYSVESDWENKYSPNRSTSKGKGYWKKGKKELKSLKEVPNSVGFYIEHFFNNNVSTATVSIKINREDDTREEEWTWVPDVSYNEYVEEYIRKMLKSYTNKGLERAIKSGNEVSFLCEKYYAVPVDDQFMSPREFFDRAEGIEE